MTSMENEDGAESIDYAPESEDDNDLDPDVAVYLDAVLPDDLLDKILSLLPVVSIIRSASVCRRWHEALRTRRCTWGKMVPQKPWYFMFTCSKYLFTFSEDVSSGFAYPSLCNWYSFDFPCIEKSDWYVSSSAGLVCLMDRRDKNRVFVCNPVTKDWKRLADAPASSSTLAISASRTAQGYTVVVAGCNYLPGEYSQHELAIHLFESESGCWVTPFVEALYRWRGGEECVICDGVLYYLVHFDGVSLDNEHQHRVIMYDLITRPSHTSLMATAIPVPCYLTCARLMNLRERLVPVGGIGKKIGLVSSMELLFGCYAIKSGIKSLECRTGFFKDLEMILLVAE